MIGVSYVGVGISEFNTWMESGGTTGTHSYRILGRLVETVTAQGIVVDKVPKVFVQAEFFRHSKRFLVHVDT